jgi:carbamoyl-phosphate synthase large subunit
VAVALKRYGGYRPFTLVGTDVNPLAVGLYQPDLFAHACVVPHASDSGYWQAIERIVDEHDIHIAVVLPEVEVLAWGRRAVGRRLPCRALIPDPALTELLVDKAGTAAALEADGLAPESVVFSRNQQVDDVGDRLGWPFWVRYPSGTSGSGSLKVDSVDVLRSWITVNSGAERFLASTYLPGRNLACTMLYYDGALRRAACAERVRYVMSRVAPSGITGNTSYGRLLHDPGVVRTAASAMDRLFSRSRSARHGVFTVSRKTGAAERL